MSRRIPYIRSSPFSSVGLPKAFGTTILLQHNGQPRTPFYAQKHFQQILVNLGYPAAITSKLAEVKFKLSSKLKSALAESGAFLPLDEAHNRFAGALAKDMNVVLPEFGPFFCKTAHLLDEKSTENALDQILRDGADRLVLLSMHPFGQNFLVKEQRTAVFNVLNREMKEIVNRDSGNRTYVAKKRPISFDLHEINDLGQRESYVRYFAERLSTKADLFDSLIFAAPISGPIELINYHNTVQKTCQRIAYAFYEIYPRALPYRCALYSSYNHLQSTFPIFSGLNAQIRSLKKFGHTKPLIVPLGSLFKDYDSETIIRNVVRKTPEAVLLSPEVEDQSLRHSFVELLKTELLIKKAVLDQFQSNPLF